MKAHLLYLFQNYLNDTICVASIVDKDTKRNIIFTLTWLT